MMLCFFLLIRLPFFSDYHPGISAIPPPLELTFQAWHVRVLLFSHTAYCLTCLVKVTHKSGTSYRMENVQVSWPWKRRNGYDEEILQERIERDAGYL